MGTSERALREHGGLKNEQSRVVVLIVHFLSWSEVWIMRVEDLLNDSPKMCRAMIQMRVDTTPQIRKIIYHNLRRRTKVVDMRCMDRSNIHQGMGNHDMDARPIFTLRGGKFIVISRLLNEVGIRICGSKFDHLQQIGMEYKTLKVIP